MYDNFSNKMQRFNYLMYEIEATYHEGTLKFGLSDSVIKILYVIYDKGEGCLLKNVIRYTGMSKQTINSALRKLESEEIIYLEAVDAKSKRIYLTDKGRKLADETAGRILQIEDEIFASWSKEDAETYLKLIEKYLVDLKKAIEKL